MNEKKDLVPRFEISLEEAKKRLMDLNQFIETQMIEGIDYGKIPGISKPTLLKPGAEKLENIYAMYHEFEQLDKQEDFEKGFFFYRYKCKVYRRKDMIKVSEAIGSCNNKEKARIGQDPYTIVNTIDKIAQKRAFVAAILSACRVSAKFTQDVEDISKIDRNHQDICSECGAIVSDNVKQFSENKFSKILCIKCQKKEEVVM